MKTGKKQKALAEHLKNFIRESVSCAGKKGIVIGVSGGLDSAVCLCLASAALGKENCRALYMPHHGGGKLNPDVDLLCSQFGIEPKLYDLSPMTEMFETMTGESDPVQKGNFGARMRMAFLYNEAASLKCLVMNTSNRTESMTGYFTKWGDEAGDISPLGNYYKSEITDFARYLDIPDRVLNAEPSAGFYSGQKDEDELGISYARLDQALKIIENVPGGEESPADIEKVREMIKKSGHKRNSPVKAARIY